MTFPELFGDNMPDPRNKSVHISVSEQIAYDIPALSGAWLPPIRELAIRYNVSHVTIIRALSVLKSKGLVQTRMGRKTQILWREAPSQSKMAKVDRVETLYQEIAEKIKSGFYRIGYPLPKRSRFATDLHFSNKTMAQVMQKLISNRLIHRLGRGYVTGPEPLRTESVQVIEAPILIICTRSASQWDGYRINLRNGPFALSFISEAKRSSVRLVNVVMDVQSAERFGVKLPAGMEGIEQVIHGAGGRYIGTLIAASSLSSPGGLVEWSRRLLSYHQPVVWFDLADETELRHPRNFGLIRCRHNNVGMAEIAIRYLHSRGHRHALYLFGKNIDWQVQRGEALLRAGMSMNPPFRVTGLPTGTWDAWQNQKYKSDTEKKLMELEKHVPVLKKKLIEFNELWFQNFGRSSKDRDKLAYS